MGPGTDTARPDRPGLFRKNSLDEMTVGRTEKPVGKPAPKKPATRKPADTAPSGTGTGAGTGPGTSTNAPHGEPVEPRTTADDAAPIRRERIGRGSYEDPADQKRKRRPGKTGRPGR